MMRTSIARLSSAASRRSFAASPFVAAKRFNSSQAISNPTLMNIEQRWEQMPPQEQAELWMELRDRMKVDWKELTDSEKKAAYFIAFGPHGPRAEAPAGETWKVVQYTIYGVVISTAMFVGIRMMAGPTPHTMTKEYQEQSNEFLKNQGTGALTFVASDNYKGPGMVQSK